VTAAAPAVRTIPLVSPLRGGGGVLALEKGLAPPTWLHLAIWLPLTLVLSLWLLPKVKGGLVGLQWALRMHGFGGETDEPDPEPQPASQA